ncbi:Aldo keto reductase [Coniophora puteana RWD-64-598 SS2]|uniref:Aldo keto reductase n=1 Tax=Coniophora puteana (strain RWD-64-598) TaxID=741705 RepID=A0A5M3MUQ4_CONPW|nr:Aldo keto reductase [Coniophora puteana RWD-64-598 SS2]EIW82770.1 Aldo keto reductase [Coniophora puteana RWD-64-598 SS2]
MSTTTLKVEYRQLGKSGLRVSVPIVGAMSFGSSQWGLAPWIVEADTAISILKEAWDLGVNTIDTANVYSNGESEHIISQFMKKYNIPRHQLIIATKCYGFVSDTSGGASRAQPGTEVERDKINQSGLSRSAIFNAVESSLTRLETPYVDLLQIHRFDPLVPVEETMKALHDLVQAGKVRYIGASSMRCWQFAMMNEVADRHGWTRFVSMSDEYSLLYREEEREMHAYCAYNGIGVIPWAPLSGGDLARPLGTSTVRSEGFKDTPYERKISHADRTIILRIIELAEKHGRTMGQVALSWAKNKRGGKGAVTSPIVGVNSVERLREALVGGFELSDEEMGYLEEP